MPYQIVNADKWFENHESRKLKKLSFVCVPNKHDGKSYRRLLKLPDGPALYGAWHIILQVASKCPTRWILADDDGDMDADDIADKSGFPVKVIEKALKALSDMKIGWITGSCNRDNLPQCREKLPQPRDSSGTNRTEQKGIEQNGTDNYSCPESLENDSEPDVPYDPIILKIDCQGPQEIFDLRQSKIDEYQKCYPLMDVTLEIRKAVQWLRDNPTRGKTAKGMTRFLGSWLSRANDRPKVGGNGQGQKSTRSTGASLIQPEDEEQYIPPF